jgi:1,4-dihydroxy-2-naphthoate octaprenyltransferase
MGKSIASRIGARNGLITHAGITAAAVIVVVIGCTGINWESVLQLSRSLKTNAVK